MIVNPVLYFASTRDLQTAVSCSLAQITGRERKLVQTIKLKFALTNIVYYVCWLPNLINGILLWTLWFQLPVKAIITLWYIMVYTSYAITVKNLINVYIIKYFINRLLRIPYKHSSMHWYTKDGEKQRNFDWNVVKNWEIIT